MNKEGEIQYLKHKFYQDNGCSPNETISPLTLIHFKNCYDARRWYIEAHSVDTDTPSNTWCRAPGKVSRKKHLIFEDFDIVFPFLEVTDFHQYIFWTHEPER